MSQNLIGVFIYFPRKRIGQVSKIDRTGSASQWKASPENWWPQSHRWCLQYFSWFIPSCIAGRSASCRIERIQFGWGYKDYSLNPLPHICFQAFYRHIDKQNDPFLLIGNRWQIAVRIYWHNRVTAVNNWWLNMKFEFSSFPQIYCFAYLK